MTLPDGETFTLRYPPAMKIAQLGFAGGDRRATASTVHDQLHDDSAHVHVYGDATRSHVYPGANGERCRCFHASQRSRLHRRRRSTSSCSSSGRGSCRSYDVDPVTDRHDRRERDLGAQPHRNRRRQRLSRAARAGAALARQHVRRRLRRGARQHARARGASLLRSDRARTRARAAVETNGDGSNGVSWCDGELHVSAGGTADVRRPRRQRAAGQPARTADGTTTPTTTTTTTTTPAAPRVARRVGELRVARSGFRARTERPCRRRPPTAARPGRRRRIARPGTRATGGSDSSAPSDGFAFDRGRRRALLITHDGGATWIDLDTPFANVYDLAILRGMVYVVGLPPRQHRSRSGSGRRPVEHLVWKRDPLSLPIGAGPVPTRAARALRDRRLDPQRRPHRHRRRPPVARTDRWAAWNPPCLGKNGPAYLAASTSDRPGRDVRRRRLGPADTGQRRLRLARRRHDVHRSRRAGLRAGRRREPDTAVVGGNGTLCSARPTTARRWTVVAKLDNADAVPSDLGFTTSTQGFVIVQRRRDAHDARRRRDLASSDAPVSTSASNSSTTPIDEQHDALRVDVCDDDAPAAPTVPGFTRTSLDSPSGACTVSVSVNDFPSSPRNCASSAFTSTPASVSAFATPGSERMPVERWRRSTLICDRVRRAEPRTRPRDLRVAEHAVRTGEIREPARQILLPGERRASA